MEQRELAQVAIGNELQTRLPPDQAPCLQSDSALALLDKLPKAGFPTVEEGTLRLLCSHM